MLSAAIPVVHVLRTEMLDEKARAEGDAALRTQLARWGDPEYPSCVRGVLLAESEDERVFRLWVRGYPRLAEEWARWILARSEAVEPKTAAWAVRAFGQLTAVGHPGAEGFLIRLCEDSLFRGQAVRALLESGAHARHERLLRKLAGEGLWEAWEALSDFDGALPIVAESLLAVRAQALRNGTWEDLARRAIRDDEPFSLRQHYLWALRIARDRRVPWLELALRERLVRSRPISGWIQLDDEGYSPALLTLAEIGGTLDERECAHLRRMGYGCEPRARLAEVLREKGY